MGERWVDIAIIGAVGAAAVATGGSSLLATAPAAAGAAGAGAGAAGAAGAAGSALSLGAILETTLAVGGAGLSVMGGFMDAAALEQQAGIDEMRARQYEIAGAENAITIRRAELDELALQNARWGASGIDISSGSPVTVAEETSKEADRQLRINRYNTGARSGMARMQAGQRRASATAAKIGGAAKGTIGLLSLASNEYA